ncbi:MAG: hypothetical protein Q7J98_00760, partial [Kiritimatiellia bacterium]|nr:hypothetical protein [Kiritimatiellia bacterium]
YETITLKTDPVKDVLYIPCFARIAFTVDEVVRIFLETARADRIKEYFSEELLEKELGPDVKYIMATRLGLWPMADQTRKSAAAVQAALGQGIQADDPGSVSINGCSGYYYEQFARARLQQPYDFACLFPSGRHGRQSLPDAMKVLDLQLPQDGEESKQISQFDPVGAGGSPLRPNALASVQLGFGEARLQRQGDEARRESGYYQRLTIPVLIGRGRYELRGELMLKLEGAETDSCVSLAVRTIKGQADADCCLELQPGTWRNFSLVFQPQRELQPQIDFQSPVAAQLYLKNMEICWSLSDALESVHGDLAMAEIRQSIHQADWEKAAAQLTALPEVNRAANELEIRQMMFTCADGLQDDFGRRPAAYNLLELAPGHYMSLLALAAEDETAGKIARQMAGNLKNPFSFAPWLALVGFSFNAETKEVRCVFEALRNETPGLAATFWLQRRGEWRRKQVQSLTACPHRYAKRCRRAGARMSKGERAVIVVRLNAAFGQMPVLDKLALGIETDVLWHAGAIPLAPGGYVVPFSRLCE